jgi:hypothetical protein
MTSITVELPEQEQTITPAQRVDLREQLRAYWREQRQPNAPQGSRFLDSLCRQLQQKRVLSPRQVTVGFEVLAKRAARAAAATNSQPAPPVDRPKREVAPFGVYRKDGEVYVVKNSRRNPGQRYAVRMVESPERMTQSGDKVKFEFVVARGMVYELSAEDRLTDVEVTEIMTRYGHCIMCNHPIKRFKSVERMMGPRCWKRMHGMAV